MVDCARRRCAVMACATFQRHRHPSGATQPVPPRGAHEGRRKGRGAASGPPCQAGGWREPLLRLRRAPTPFKFPLSHPAHTALRQPSLLLLLPPSRAAVNPLRRVFLPHPRPASGVPDPSSPAPASTWPEAARPPPAIRPSSRDPGRQRRAVGESPMSARRRRCGSSTP